MPDEDFAGYEEWLDEVAAAAQVDIDHEQFEYEMAEAGMMLAGGLI